MDPAASMFACPACDRRFRWKPELAGRSVRCKCGMKIAVSQDPPAPMKRKSRQEPEPEVNPLGDWLNDLKQTLPAEDPSPSGLRTLPAQKRSWWKGAKQSAGGMSGGSLPTRSGEGDGPKLKVAGAGLMIHFGGFVLLAISLGMLIARVASQGIPQGKGVIGHVHGAITGMCLLGMGMIVLGPLLCLWVPSQAGRWLLIGGILSYFVAIIVPVVGAEQQHPVLFILAGVVLMLIGTGCVLSFLARLADYLNEPSVQAGTESLLNLYKLMLAGYIVALGLSVIPIVGAIAMGVINLMVLLILARYILINGRLAFVMLRR